MLAKISVPRLTESHPRPRLFRALDAARRKKVVWVSAPAGAGKTSVVAMYLEVRRVPALWYNVDARDGDAAHLFHYLALAVRRASRRRRAGLPVFASENQRVTAFARGFFEALFAERPRSSVIVLDDYHDAGSDLFDEVIREAIAALPGGMSIIVISRTDPPPLLLRAVAAGQIAFIGVADLRLTPRDVAGLVRIHRPDLRGAKLRLALPRIIELANGWAAALTLLLQDRSMDGFDPLALEQFSERLFDYFATEVFDNTTAAQRDFLLKTSVVPSLTATLAARLTSAPDTARLLAHFERRSFLIERFGTSGAYRYHPLLRGFLLRRAEADLGRSAVHDLHCRAAVALAEMKQVDEAMEQYEAAREVEARVRLLLELASTYVGRGRHRTLANWITRLPPERVERDGWLLYWLAVSSFGSWEKRPCEWLERAYAIFAREGAVEGLHLACAAAMQAIVQEGTNFTQLDVWLNRFESLERDGPRCPEPLLPMAATGMLMASAFRRADFEHNRKWAERALQLAPCSHDLAHRVITGGFLALHYSLYEGPARAVALLEMLRAFEREAACSVLPKATVMQADALCAWLQGENERTVEKIRVYQAFSARTGVFMWNDFLYGLGVGAALALKDFALAREFLEPMADIAQQRGGWPAGFYHFEAGWTALSRGDTLGALLHAELAIKTAEAQGPPFGRIVCYLLLAQILPLIGRNREAPEALALATRRADEGACAVLRFGCYLVESDLVWDEDRARALACLHEGFRFARERGFHNVFGLARATLERAVVRALEHGIEPDHLQETIRRHGLQPDRLSHRLKSWPWRYRIWVLGTFALVIDHAPTADKRPDCSRRAEDPRGMPLRLLQAISSFGGRGVRDFRVIDALWPDAEGDAGRRLLDTTLHRLRRQMGNPDFVRLTDGRLYLDERVCWLDLWAFDELTEEAQRELARGAPSCAFVALAEHLLHVYRGPLLDDDAAPWIVGPRERVAARFRRVAEVLGRKLECDGYLDESAALRQRMELPSHHFAERHRVRDPLAHRATRS